MKFSDILYDKNASFAKSNYISQQMTKQPPTDFKLITSYHVKHQYSILTAEKHTHLQITTITP